MPSWPSSTGRSCSLDLATHTSWGSRPGVSWRELTKASQPPPLRSSALATSLHNHKLVLLSPGAQVSDTSFSCDLWFEEKTLLPFTCLSQNVLPHSYCVSLKMNFLQQAVPEGHLSGAAYKNGRSGSLRRTDHVLNGSNSVFNKIVAAALNSRFLVL